MLRTVMLIPLEDKNKSSARKKIFHVVESVYSYRLNAKKNFKSVNFC